MQQKKQKWQQFKSRNQFLILLFSIIFGGLTLTTMLTLNNDSIWLSLAQLVLSFGTFLFIFFSQRDPSTKWAWILIIFALPIIGIGLFLLFGRNKKHIAQFHRKIQQNSEFDDHYEAFVPLKLANQNQYQQRQYQFLQTIATRPMYQNTAVSLQVGRQFFDELTQAIQQAQHHIHLEFYIVRYDEVTKPIFQALFERAKAGVEVRFLVDAGGSFNTLPDQIIAEWIQAGIQFAFFGQPQSLILDSTINWRNHRKVVVIDGEVGFIGGFNLGAEYVFGTERINQWRDTNLRLQGEAVRSLQTLFLADWYFSTHDDFARGNQGEFFPKVPTVKTADIVQIISDGPDTPKSPLKNSLYKLITSATSRIWLTTPYLILPDDILQALKAAALSGVDVRISIPGAPDKWLIYRCTQSYLEELLEVGVKIYVLTDTFQHSKVWVFDTQFGACGTANLDYRSLVINFEAMALVSGKPIVKQLAQMIATDFQNSQQLDLRTWQQRSLWQKVTEGIIRLFSPIF